MTNPMGQDDHPGYRANLYNRADTFQRRRHEDWLGVAGQPMTTFISALRALADEADSRLRPIEIAGDNDLATLANDLGSKLSVVASKLPGFEIVKSDADFKTLKPSIIFALVNSAAAAASTATPPA